MIKSEAIIIQSCPGRTEWVLVVFWADSQVWRHVTHCSLLFNHLLTVENEKEGEVSLYLPPKLSAAHNHWRHLLQRGVSKPGEMWITRKKECVGWGESRETQTQTEKNQQNVESIFEIDKLSRGGWRERSCVGIHRNSGLLVSWKEWCRWGGRGVLVVIYFPCDLYPHLSPWHCHGDHSSLRLWKQTTWQRWAPTFAAEYAQTLLLSSGGELYSV